MTKAELRKKYILQRNALTEADYFECNRRLCDSFFSHVNLTAVKVLHTFLPMEKKREPDTWLIIDRIRRDFQSIRISIPKVNLKSAELEHFYLESRHRVRHSEWGIPEPEGGVPTPIEKIDMVIVPLLAFDQSGHRIGFGKGYYDKFLIKCRKDARKVGLSFFPPELQIKGLESHDIALDCCITPYRMYNF